MLHRQYMLLDSLQDEFCAYPIYICIPEGVNQMLPALLIMMLTTYSYSEHISM